MRLLRTFLSHLSRTPNRSFAQVHDVQIEVALKRARGTSPPPPDSKTMSRNVFGQPLQLHSTRPLTGFTRTGYCEAPKSDAGNHSIAAEVTDEFLDFSAARGNDLRTAGLTNGCKWCLCVSRWKEAFDARKNDRDPTVPKVFLSRTNERALEGVSMDALKQFAANEDTGEK